MGKTKDEIKEPHYHGHRQRLKEKLLTKGAESLADYELLELLLMLALPRKDVKPLAKELLSEFKDFTHIINAKDENLLKIIGIKEGTLSVFKIIKAVSLRVVKDNTYNNQEFNNLDELAKYLKAAMGYLEKEQLRVLFLNNSNALIKDEILQEGTINQTQIYPREIVKRALELSASSIIMAHNHPSGDLIPSEADIHITKKIKKVCETIDIQLLEHMIITKKGYTPIISGLYIS